MSRSRRLAALTATLAVAACSGAQSPLNPAGEQAERTFSLLGLMLWVCGGVYLLVLGFLAWALWRALKPDRGDARDPANPDDGHLRTGLGVWAGVVVGGLTVLVIGSFLAERGLAAARDRAALPIRVTGHQWWWRIQYRDPGTGAWIETANELHLPANQTARVELGSADVIHSFWVPNVAGKMDVIPGHAKVIDLTPHRLGWFRGQCAEFCGAQHAHMAFDVKVESPADFQAWLAAQSRPALASADPVLAHGREVLETGPCGACHAVRGTEATGIPGPDLTHIASRRTVAAGTLPMNRGSLQGWIAQPQALKPGTNMPAVPLSPADANAVSAYLASLT